jgi:3-oxoacyl-[acyl-carrier-protein] synthase III
VSQIPLDEVCIGYLGYGCHLPAAVLTNADLEQIVDTSDAWIERRTGIRERRILARGETILDMAVAASRQALADAGVEPEQLGEIRVAVNTWLRFPSLATQLQRALGAHAAAAADVAAGCAGFIYGVEDVHNKLLIEKARYGHDLYGLVVGVEGLSHITDWTDRSTCVLLGDGAGAVVMGQTRDAGIEATYTHADGRHGDLLYSDFVVECQRCSERENFFVHGVRGVRPYLRMDGPKVFPIAVKSMVHDILAVIDKYNRAHETHIEVEDIDYFFPHQANLRIIEAAAKRLDIPLAKMYTNGVVRYGNTSTASIPIGYCETRERTNGRSGAHLEIDVAFGAGFASGAILRRLSP